MALQYGIARELTKASSYKEGSVSYSSLSGRDTLKSQVTGSQSVFRDLVRAVLTSVQSSL